MAEDPSVDQSLIAKGETRKTLDALNARREKEWEGRMAEVVGPKSLESRSGQIERVRQRAESLGYRMFALGQVFSELGGKGDPSVCVVENSFYPRVYVLLPNSLEGGRRVIAEFGFYRDMETQFENRKSFWGSSSRYVGSVEHLGLDSFSVVLLPPQGTTEDLFRGNVKAWVDQHPAHLGEFEYGEEFDKTWRIRYKPEGRFSDVLVPREARFKTVERKIEGVEPVYQGRRFDPKEEIVEVDLAAGNVRVEIERDVRRKFSVASGAQGGVGLVRVDYGWVGDQIAPSREGEKGKVRYDDFVEGWLGDLEETLKAVGL